MRKILLVILALALVRLLPRQLRRGVTAVGLLAALPESLALAATPPPNTSMTYSNMQRTAALETRVGNLEQGIVPNVQSGSTIGTLQRGIFTNVSGGSVITLETQQGSV